MQWRGEQIVGATVAIGIFDGVHLGHQEILKRAKEVSNGKGVIALTFDPHPMQFFAPDKAPTMLVSVERRVELLKQHGADAVIVCEFDSEFAKKSPEEFVSEVLVKHLKISGVVVGENFSYGHKALGKVADLIASGKSHGFVAEEVALAEIDGAVVSSTRIRQAIAVGDIDLAKNLLSRPHRLQGIVVHGEKRGREIGYPTANLGYSTSYNSVPADGVYAGWLEVGGQRWASAISIGTNPTFAGERSRQVEAYALDQIGLDLYDQSAVIDFGWRLRDTLKFDGLEPLLEQMKKDCDQARILTQ
ncbi:MAG: bifunctional riboflavin kinase/FAD synthetase [Actinobacteria bacterium]|nr:bifunctional riboflavin kinase/FAD synthetase [Actinomycetota bacterium]MSW75780.1 bifunctional riboflavin kinase/FAD synthetase [Actinomycetota bacterium]MSY31162.1 bifunctional riboflavin kinase/FAD synthetase [Actinomycetota bacterium]